MRKKYYKKRIRKQNWRPDYDQKLINDFRKKNPKLIEAIELRILKEKPRLNFKTLRRLVNKEILPPVLERSEVDNTWGGKDVIPISQINENTIKFKIS